MILGRTWVEHDGQSIFGLRFCIFTAIEQGFASIGVNRGVIGIRGSGSARPTNEDKIARIVAGITKGLIFRQLVGFAGYGPANELLEKVVRRKHIFSHLSETH